MNYPKAKKVSDKKYLRWVHTQPCLICGEKHQDTVVPHHFMGRHRDDKVVPLCVYHHAENASNYSVHRLLREKFEVHFGVDLEVEGDKMYGIWRSL